MSKFKQSSHEVSSDYNCNDVYLTIILRNRAEYRLILSRVGLRPLRLKSDDIPQD